jgi:hypothetical protein
LSAANKKKAAAAAAAAARARAGARAWWVAGPMYSGSYKCSNVGIQTREGARKSFRALICDFLLTGASPKRLASDEVHLKITRMEATCTNGCIGFYKNMYVQQIEQESGPWLRDLWRRRRQEVLRSSFSQAWGACIVGGHLHRRIVALTGEKTPSATVCHQRRLLL